MRMFPIVTAKIKKSELGKYVKVCLRENTHIRTYINMCFLQEEPEKYKSVWKWLVEVRVKRADRRKMTVRRIFPKYLL